MGKLIGRQGAHRALRSLMQAASMKGIADIRNH